MKTGATVYYYSDKQKYLDKKAGTAQPMVAIVAFDNGNGTVNVAYFEQDGKAKDASNVPLVTALPVPATGAFCVDPVLMGGDA
jgi:hypothetical protein